MDPTPASTSSPEATAIENRRHGINLFGLIALVVSSSIGSGVFALSTDISAAAAPGPALVAWLITGIGFMGLATTFGRLSLVKPELDGIVAYARAGFGPFVGFISGWGYWLSIWIGNVAFGVMLVTAIGYFYPPFAGNLGLGGVLFISVVKWLIVALVNRGIEAASVINAIVMVCKLVPIFAFIASMVIMFRLDVFTADFWGTLANNVESGPGPVSSQIINCFMVMMWVFVGMEGASVLGHRAARKSDVSRATVLGCTALVIIYVAASILPYGFLTREELMMLGSPSMPYIFERVVGPWGGAFISAGLIISIFGAWLSVAKRDVVRAILTAAFLVIAITLSGIEQLMLCCIAYVPGIAFYMMARREQGTAPFTRLERVVALFICLITGIMLATIAGNLMAA